MRQATGLILLIFGIGCHRVARSPISPIVVADKHCWWAVLNTRTPPDSVAMAFRNAFATAGFSRVSWSIAGDTARTVGGPSTLANHPNGHSYSARAVAYRRDSITYFRFFTGDTLLVQAAQPDTVNISANSIGLCAEIVRALPFRFVRPKEPTGDETLSVWRISHR